MNGCQTSNVLYENRNELTDEIMLTIKVVEASNSDVVSDIVKATNSQTKVDPLQFLSLEPIIRKVEAYFESFADDSNEEIKLYFERRERQFINQEIPTNRIFDIKEASRAVASMFLERPDLAVRYPNQMIQDLNNDLFHNKNPEIAFYAACLALYRIKLLIGNKKIPYDYGKYKWHMLMCLPHIIYGEKAPQLTAHRKVNDFCKKIIDVCNSNNDENFKHFQTLANLFCETGEVNRDQLTARRYSDELKRLIHERLKKSRKAKAN